MAFYYGPRTRKLVVVVNDCRKLGAGKSIFTSTPNSRSSDVSWLRAAHDFLCFSKLSEYLIVAASPRKEPNQLTGTIVDWFVTTLIKTPGSARREKKALAVDTERANILRLLRCSRTSLQRTRPGTVHRC